MVDAPSQDANQSAYGMVEDLPTTNCDCEIAVAIVLSKLLAQIWFSWRRGWHSRTFHLVLSKGIGLSGILSFTINFSLIGR